MKFLFFDTETTGNTTEDYLCQIAYTIESESFNELYKPPKLIPPEASAVHHITNKMVCDKGTFRDSADYARIKTLFENPEIIPVAHNAKFDIGMLKKEDIHIGTYICTLRLARALDTESKIPRYNLQFLRYFLDMEIDAVAHDAMGDVKVLQVLFERLREKYLEKNNGDKEKALAEMITVSSAPSLMHTFNFGKHVGKKIEDVAREDRGYLEWLYKQKKQNPNDEEDWIYTLEKYLLNK
jgi:exodeoxyribonuclease X